MLNFREITKADFPLLDKYFGEAADRNRQTRVCDYAPGTVKMWHGVYGMKFAEAGGCLLIFATFEEGVRCYMMPVGADRAAGLRALISHLDSEGGGTVSVVPAEDIPLLSAASGKRAEGVPTASRDWADYIYLKADFESPSGKARHKQKNLINRFMRENPEAHFETLSSENMGAALEYFTDYCRRNPESSSVLGDEYRVTAEVISDITGYGMCGGLLYSGREICGLTIGEIYGDTVYVHTEKAEKDKTGAYQAISSLFLKSIFAPDAVYVNREEDMGLPGLRRSKTAYAPIRLDYKYSLTLKPAETTNCEKTIDKTAP